MPPISKSLYKAWRRHPRLGWWYARDRATYDRILAEEGGTAGADTGAAVEEQVLRLYPDRQPTRIPVDPAHMPEDEALTRQAMDQGADLITQAVLQAEDLRCVADLLLREPDGRYSLVEVKSKSSIRKDTRLAALLPDLADDLSFQRLVLQQALGNRFTGRCSLAYVNKDYVFDEVLDPRALILEEEVSAELYPPEEVLRHLQALREDVALTDAEFLERHPYDGKSHLWWYGTPPPPDSVCTIPRMSPKLVPAIRAGRRALADLLEEDLHGLSEKQVDYIRLWREGERKVDREVIRRRLQDLTRPWHFYDYETLLSPIPLLRGTRPNQQVVVQWSMHTQEREGGPLTHHQDILRPGETDNRRVLQSLADLARHGEGTFIVWHQAFENTRNQDIARDHPDLAEVFLGINARTFDLEKIFADWLCFDRRFQGSSSIKRVLPVLTEVGYEDLAIRKGDQAAELLRRLALQELPPETIAPTLRDLLAYCERDTLAMVKVMEVILEGIAPEKIKQMP